MTAHPFNDDYNDFRRLYLIHLGVSAGPDSLGMDYGLLSSVFYKYYTSQMDVVGGQDSELMHYESGSDGFIDTMLLRQSDTLYIALMKTTNSEDDTLFITGITDTVLSVWVNSDASRQPSVNVGGLPACALANSQVSGSWDLPAATGGIQ
ncbi:MAG: hypothetical protein ACUVRD_03050 [Bacteroidia bacterium]